MSEKEANEGQSDLDTTWSRTEREKVCRLTTHEDLILERSSVRSVRLSESLLDLTSNSRHRLDARSLELGDLESRVEHVLDERRVLEDLVRNSRELELLDDLGRPIDVENDSRRGDSESWSRRVEGVERAESGVGEGDGSVEGGGTVHVFGSVLEESVSDGVVVEMVDGEGLESTPTEGEDERIVRLEDLNVPSMSLDSNGEESESFLGWEDPSDDDGEGGIEVVDHLARNS